LFSQPAFAAESVTRKHEKPLSGEVTGVSKTEVTVKVKTPREETLTIPASEVQNIAWSGEPPEANLARSDEAAGRLQKALDGYKRSQSASKATNPLARLELEYAIVRTSAKLALADPEKADEAIRQLEELRSKLADHYRHYEALQLLGQLYLVRKDFPKAQAAFDALSRAPWPEARMAAKIATARLLADDNKPDDALSAFDAVIAMNAAGAAEDSLRQEAVLGKSRVLVSQRKYDEAQSLLADVIARADPEDARVNAEAHLRLGDCLREQGKETDALLAYLYVDVLPHLAAERALHAEALYQLARLWDKIGRKDRAAEAREKLQSDELKDSEWARRLAAPPGG
jgi:tetratricopeptide (TPR) repeat protein